MRADLVRASYLQADETVVRCRCMTAEARIIKPTYGNTGVFPNGRGGETVFDFNWAAAAMGPAKFLRIEWILQTDGYQAYDHVGGPGLIHMGCWAHAATQVRRCGEGESERRRGDRDGHAPWTRCF